MPPKRPRRSQTPTIPGPSKPRRRPRPSRTPTRRTSTQTPTPGPSASKSAGKQPVIIQPTPTPVQPTTSSIHIPSPGNPIYISDDIETDVTYSESESDTSPIRKKLRKNDAPTPQSYPNPSNPAPNPGEPKPLTGTIYDFVHLATDEVDLLRAIGRGRGVDGRPVPASPARSHSRSEGEGGGEEGFETVTGEYVHRPTDPEVLEEWKRGWVADGRRVGVEEYPSQIPGVMLGMAGEEVQERDGERDRLMGEVEEDGPAAVRSRFRPAVTTGPPEFWFEEASYTRPEGVEEVVDPDESDRAVGALKRMGWEWEEDMDIHGVWQPPLGVRLEHVLNFLRDGDVDRTQGWGDKLAEVEGFLEWVDGEYDIHGEVGEDEIVRRVSAEVRNMFLDARRKVKVHRLFERWHYGTAGAALETPGDAVKIVSRRQPGWEVRRDAAAHFRFVPREAGRELEPRKMLVHEPQQTNTLYPAGSQEGKAFRTALAEAGKQFWSGEDVGPEKNLYLAEDAAYRAYMEWRGGQYNLTVNGEGKLPDPEEVKRVNKLHEVDAEGRVPEAIAKEREEEIDFGPRPKPGWMTQQEYAELTAEATGAKPAVVDTGLDPELYDVSDREDTPMVNPAEDPQQGSEPDTATFRDFKRKAEIRGTRRAALQEALRTFTNIPNQVAQSKWNTVVPPIEQRYLEAIKRDLDRNHQYSLPTISWNIAPVDIKDIETMPYTIHWRLHRKALQDVSEKALAQVNDENANINRWVNIPRNITCGGPFTWRRLAASVDESHDLLKECETVLAALVRTAEKDDSELLSDVCRLALGAIDAPGPRGTLPEGVVLRDNEYKEGSRTIKPPTPDELAWLRFLTGRAANKKMLKPLPESKFTLYNLFVKRLEKLMDARNPNTDALFRKKDSVCTVEELVNAMNDGCEGPVQKTAFTPFQAKLFLERAQEQGICMYRPDPLVYGRIYRPKHTIHPWDHITFAHGRPTPAYTLRQPQPSTLTFNQPGPQPFTLPHRPQDAEIRLQIAQIFRDLAFRLGVTITTLRLELHKRHRLLDPEDLQTSLNTYHRLLAQHTYTYESHRQAQTSIPRNLSLIRLIGAANTTDLANPAIVYPRHLTDTTEPSLAYLSDTTAVKSAVTEESALRLIRRRIIEESHTNAPLLARGRTSTTPIPGRSWDHTWFWASPPVRGKVRHYFSLNRWPLAFQTESTRHKIESDEEVDIRYTFNVLEEDPIPATYLREKLRRYGEDDDEVVFRPGTPRYWEGDTVSQRRYVRRLMEERIGEAFGIRPQPPPRPRTWIGQLKAKMPWTQDEKEMPDSPAWDANLPKVDRKMIPRSQNPWDPEVERRIRVSAGLPPESEFGDAEMVDV